MVLDIVFSDGTHSHAWGGADWIEEAIEQAAISGRTITSWAINDEKEATPWTGI